MVDVREKALEAMEAVFGDRLTRRQPGRSSPDGALASVFPTSAEEVALLAGITDRYSLPLVALWAETTPEQRARGKGVLVRFDLMRGLRLSDAEEPLAEAEPGALWLELDNDLRVRGRGLTVYPMSAPRATIGGWLALDGVGVGSFEYGRLSEKPTRPSRARSPARARCCCSRSTPVKVDPEAGTVCPERGSSGSLALRPVNRRFAAVPCDGGR